MRINLLTPFAEKDAAKALGARWDAKTRNWYIVGVADLTPFLRWIPDSAAASGAQLVEKTPSTTQVKHHPAKPSSRPAKATQATQASVQVAHCGCKVLPWEPCIHSDASRLRATASATLMPSTAADKMPPA
ncbi:MAG: DUF5710 domain-containing protein [Rhodoferax sp.]|nr:DUF5710 domain-containing protein [Rhodoferax sp.]